MIPALIAISVPLGLLAGLGLVYWLVVVGRTLRALAGRISIRRGLEMPDPPGPAPKLSIIVPAHNEERVIEQCVTTLRAQTWPDLEIIFVLDRCTDRTLKLLRARAEQDPRIVIIENESCPDDWAGKCNAARIGAERATGDWLLFTDADTIFDPRLARTAVSLATHRDVHLLTLYSTLTCTHWHERVAQAVACISLLQIYPMDRVDRSRPPRAFANGQFMLFRRGWYDRIGGHAGVKDDLLEDLAFARLLRRHGGTGEVRLSHGMLRCSMYDSLGAFKTGWHRIFIDACKRRPRRIRKHGRRALVAGVALPAAQVTSLAAAGGLFALGAAAPAWSLVAVVAAGLLAQVVALSIIYPLTGTPRRMMVFYPVGGWVVGRILLRAARALESRDPISWGGREYLPEPR